VGGGIVRLHEFLAQVMNHVVAQLGRQPRPRGHLLETGGEWLVDAERVRAVLERFEPERPRGRQRARLREVAVAGDANRVVEFATALETLAVPALDDSRMIGFGR